MRYFIEKIARRFDLCDPERHFALVVPWRAAFCPPLLDAALALSARCLSRTSDFDSYISNRYYQRCLNALISTLGIADALKNQDLFAAVVLLRTLEEIDGEPVQDSLRETLMLCGRAIIWSGFAIALAWRSSLCQCFSFRIQLHPMVTRCAQGT
jgi:hypothetical protein